MTAQASPPTTRSAAERLVKRFDASVFDLGRPQARLRMRGEDGETCDVIIENGGARVGPAK